MNKSLLIGMGLGAMLTLNVIAFLMSVAEGNGGWAVLAILGALANVASAVLLTCCPAR